jgi:hypothetical protein
MSIAIITKRWIEKEETHSKERESWILLMVSK